MAFLKPKITIMENCFHKKASRSAVPSPSTSCNSLVELSITIKHSSLKGLTWTKIDKPKENRRWKQ